MTTYMDFRIALGRAIRRWRKARELTQVQLSDKVDSDPPNISRIEKGKQGVAMELLLAIADALEVPLSLLIREAEGKPLSADTIEMASRWEAMSQVERSKIHTIMLLLTQPSESKQPPVKAAPPKRRVYD